MMKWFSCIDDVDLAIMVIGLIAVIIAICLAFLKPDNQTMLAMIGLINSAVVGIGSLARGRRNNGTNGEGGTK